MFLRQFKAVAAGALPPAGIGIRCLLLFVVALTLAGHGSVAAEAEEDEPLWEVGALGVVAWLPDYPAAGQNHVRWLAVPRIVYRGRIVQVGEKGLIRGLLVGTERVELDISASGSFPADSDDNRARRGMPDLDWLGEVGPRLTLGLIGDRERSGLSLDLQARAVFSTDLSSAEYRGLVFHPELVWRESRLFRGGPRLEVRFGPVFADRRLMDYFYGVPLRFVTAERSRFEAAGGYLGSLLYARLERRLNERLRLRFDTRLGLHAGATNEDSPLFRDSLTIGFATSLAWTFWQSERRVPR